MQNLSRIFVEENPQSYMASLYACIQTSGVYRSIASLGPVDLEVCDVGGARAVRKKLIQFDCMEDLDYAIYVADLNGYCQYLQEDLNVVGQFTQRDIQPMIARSEPDVGITTTLRKSPQSARADRNHCLLILEQS